jgi:hypothetical protein
MPIRMQNNIILPLCMAITVQPKAGCFNRCPKAAVANAVVQRFFAIVGRLPMVTVRSIVAFMYLIKNLFNSLAVSGRLLLILHSCLGRPYGHITRRCRFYFVRAKSVYQWCW